MGLRPNPAAQLWHCAAPEAMMYLGATHRFGYILKSINRGGIFAVKKDPEGGNT
jgi:hypothetical protein